MELVKSLTWQHFKTSHAWKSPLRDSDFTDKQSLVFWGIFFCSHVNGPNLLWLDLKPTFLEFFFFFTICTNRIGDVVLYKLPILRRELC